MTHVHYKYQPGWFPVSDFGTPVPHHRRSWRDRRPRGSLAVDRLVDVALFAACAALLVALSGHVGTAVDAARGLWSAVVAEPADGGIGASVRSGDIAFTVTKIRCDVRTVGDGSARERAHGSFCLASVAATNIGDRARVVATADQRLVDGEGNRFATDGSAEAHVAGGDWLVRALNPGATTKGTLVFDVPEGVEPVEIRLSGGGLLDDPARVALR